MKRKIKGGQSVIALVAAFVLGCASSPDFCVCETKLHMKEETAKRPLSPSCRQSKLSFKLGMARYSMCEHSLGETLDILQDIDFQLIVTVQKIDEFSFSVVQSVVSGSGLSLIFLINVYEIVRISFNIMFCKTICS